MSSRLAMPPSFTPPNTLATCILSTTLSTPSTCVVDVNGNNYITRNTDASLIMHGFAYDAASEYVLGYK